MAQHKRGLFKEFGVYKSLAGKFLHNVNTTSSFSGSPVLTKVVEKWHVVGIHLAKAPPVMIDGCTRSMANIAASNPSLTELRICCGLIKGMPKPLVVYKDDHLKYLAGHEQPMLDLDNNRWVFNDTIYKNSGRRVGSKNELTSFWKISSINPDVQING